MTRITLLPVVDELIIEKVAQETEGIDDIAWYLADKAATFHRENPVLGTWVRDVLRHVDDPQLIGYIHGVIGALYYILHLQAERDIQNGN